jgi:hypothetical protein
MAPDKLREPPTAIARMIRGILICVRIKYSIPSFDRMIGIISDREMEASPMLREKIAASTTSKKIASINIDHLWCFFLNICFFNLAN